MSRIKTLIFSSIALAVLGGMVPVAATSSPPKSRISELSGAQLAHKLGLQVIGRDGGDLRDECDSYIAEAGGVAYCLEGMTGEQAWETWYKLRGLTPSEFDRQIYELDRAIAAATSDDERTSLEEQLSDLWTAYYSGVNQGGHQHQHQRS
jgi:hypothetical protein